MRLQHGVSIQRVDDTWFADFINALATDVEALIFDDEGGLIPPGAIKLASGKHLASGTVYQAQSGSLTLNGWSANEICADFAGNNTQTSIQVYRDHRTGITEANFGGSVSNARMVKFQWRAGVVSVDNNWRLNVDILAKGKGLFAPLVALSGMLASRRLKKGFVKAINDYARSTGRELQKLSTQDPRSAAQEILDAALWSG